MRKSIIDLILRLSNRDLTFQQKCLLLEQRLNNVTKQELINNLVEFSVIPESFSPDSTEEKLWAKFSDMLLAKSFNFLDFETQVILQRSNSADVTATHENYSLVADAKTSRLSVSTTNPKDLKIPAINGWRGNTHDYSILLAPFRLFFKNRSQIYSEAVFHNVTLISYIHLSFLLIHYDSSDLVSLWTVGQNLQQPAYDFQKAKPYWERVENTVCQIFSLDISEFENHKTIENSKIEAIGNTEIRKLKRKLSDDKSQYENLNKNEIITQLSEGKTEEELIMMIIGSSNSEKKIERIQKSINSLKTNE